MANKNQIWELKTLYPELHNFILADSAYQLMFIVISVPTFLCRSTQCFECYFKLRMAFFAVTVYLMEWGLQLIDEEREDWKMVSSMEEFKPLCEVIHIVTQTRAGFVYAIMGISMFIIGVLLGAYILIVRNNLNRRPRYADRSPQDNV